MSQIALAMGAETTQRYVSFIESGRSLPGRGMIIRLAEALDLQLRGRNALLLAAGYAPVYRETHFDDPKLGHLRRALEHILAGHLPYPAVIVDRHGDLVAGNEAFWGLTDTVAPELLAQPVSIPRLLLHPKGMAPRIINLDTWAWHVIEALSREEEHHPSKRREALIAELEAIVPERPPTSSSDYVGLAVPLRLRSPEGELQLLTTLTHFGTADDVTIGELRLEAFLPANEATASILAVASRQRYRETA
jgi:transcriptional regulator with XRE-family HTH domain